MADILSSKDKKISVSEITRVHIEKWNKQAREGELNILNCDFNHTIRILSQLLLERWRDEEE